MAVVRLAPQIGPLYHVLEFKSNTKLSTLVEPLVLRHILAGKGWETLFRASAAMNIAQGIDFVMHNVFDPTRASRLFKKHLTPDSLMTKAAAKGLVLQWEEAVFVLMCIAKVGISGYDPTFILRDCLDVPESGAYLTPKMIVDMANAFAFLDAEFYPNIVAAISKANTHVNDGLITEEGKMRTYYMGTDIPAQVISEFHVAWTRIATRAANGTLVSSYNAAEHLSQLNACIAQRFLSLTDWQARYGQWSGALLPIFDYANFTKECLISKVKDTTSGKERYQTLAVDVLRAKVASVPAIKEGALLEGAARVLNFLKSKHDFLVVTKGVEEVGRIAPFTRLSTYSAILPSYDARPYDGNPVIAISEVTPTLYGQLFLMSSTVTAGISGVIKDAHNSLVQLYNEIKQSYINANAPFTKREFLDDQTAAAVRGLDPMVMLDAGLDCVTDVLPATERGRVILQAHFTGDVAATLAAVGFVGFNQDFQFEFIDDLFTATATDDRFTAIKNEPFYGLPIGDEVPFVNTVKNALMKKYNLMTVIHPDEFRTSIVLPKIKGRKAIRATAIMANYGVNHDTIFLSDYFFRKEAESLDAALRAIWTPASLMSEDTDDLIIDAAMAINARAVPLFGDWVKNQMLQQHSEEHYTFASHAEQNRFRMCQVMSCARLYIRLIEQFSPTTAKTLYWVVRTAGSRAALNYFNLYLEK